ncbi:hypothetical protein [Parasitella parasitica]|uniref:Uncharacterized protein n=1 Tax=Parasitella parasitica TaxID=35722 RepID=A0A0B7N9L0_9FUNG|nr:hypothetical protein [Parasitella parasitica]
MTQRLCNEYQYEDNEESSNPSNTINSSKSQVRANPRYDRNPHDEASDMLCKILNMSNANETSTATNALNADDNSDSDISYWSEDERTILKAYYDNERDDVNDHNDGSDDEILLEKYVMDLCQTANSNTTIVGLPVPAAASLTPPPRPSLLSSSSCTSSSSASASSAQ